jgi:hypothetical protein
MNTTRSRSRAFTLFELLVVIATTFSLAEGIASLSSTAGAITLGEVPSYREQVIRNKSSL